MKHALLIVGDALKANELVLNYIFETYKKHFKAFGNVYFSPKTDPNLPFLFEKLSQDYEVVTIYAHKESFALTNKILSTLTEDALSLKDGILVPSKVTNYEKNSYIINLGKCTINVLHVEENKTLPNILHVKNFTSANIHLIGLDEDSCGILLESLRQTYEVTTNITPLVQGWLQIEAKAKSSQNIKEFKINARELFKGKIFINQSPIVHIIDSLKRAEKTISVAESCTGGLISSLITSIAGSSQVYEGGLTTYSNRIKSSWLGVDESVLKSHGAVSEATIREMLDGALKASESDFALATSGIAGPDGGTKDKPVGTVFVGAASKDGGFLVERLLLDGDRNYIQNQSAYSAFKLLFDLEPDIFF